MFSDRPLCLAIAFSVPHESKKRYNGEETRFLIDTNQQEYAQVIEEYQPNGTVKNSYVHGIDLISKEDTNGRIYYQVDGLGSTRLLTDNNGAVVVEYDYDAYGNLTRKVGDESNNYLFAGEQFDEATDGYYLRARYYDSATGRFVSGDSFEGYNDEPLTLHDYLYGNNNPVVFVDPSGEVALAIEDGAILALSVALLASVTTATLTSNVGTFNVRSIPLGIAIACVFLKTASALYLASGDGSLIEEGCGFNILLNKKKDGEDQPVGGHTKNKRPSSKGKHEKGDARRKKDQEKASKNPNRRKRR